MEYVQNLKSQVKCNQADRKIVCNVPHPLPSKNMTGLRLAIYLGAPARHSLTNLVKFTTSTTINVYVDLNFEDINKCIRLGADSEYFNYQCVLELDYISTEQGMTLKLQTSRLTVRIPRRSDEIIIGGGPVLRNRCDCDIIPDANYTSKIYKADCKEEITDDLKYGDTICLEVKGNDVVTNNKNFTITSVMSEYQASKNIKGGVEIIDLVETKCGFADKCEEGKAYAILKLLDVGEVKFSMVMVLEGTEENDTERSDVKESYTRATLSNSESLIGMRAEFPIARVVSSKMLT